jgi:O-antigen/teichoic acid export membrane protein
MSPQSKSKALLNLTLLYTISNLATRLLNFGLIFATTFYLTKEEVGDYDLFIVTLALLTPVATLQLQEAALRWLLEDSSPKNLRKVFSTIVILLGFSSLCMAAFLGIALFFQWYSYVFSLFVLMVLQCLFIVFQQVVRGMGNNKLFVLSSILYSLIYAALAVYSLIFTSLKIDGLIWANIAGSFLTCIYLIGVGNLLPQFSISAWRRNFAVSLLKYSLPLIPNTLSWWAISSISRYFIVYLEGKAANGVFSIAQKIPTILLIFTSIFYQAWQEKSISEELEKQTTNYHEEVFSVYLRLLFSISICIVVCSRYLLGFMVSPEFFEAWHYTSILILGVIFNSLSSFHGTSYLSRKDTRGVLFSSLSGGALSVLMSWFLIPVWGLMGASLAILLGYFVVFLIRNADAMKHYQMKFPMALFGTLLLVFFISSVLNEFENPGLDLVNLIFSALAIWFINRKEIARLFSKTSVIQN